MGVNPAKRFRIVSVSHIVILLQLLPVICSLIHFTDCYADLPSSSVPTRETTSSCFANSSHLTLCPPNNSIPNSDNGHYNTPLLEYYSAQHSSCVYVLPDNDHILLLNNGSNILKKSKEIPLMLFNGTKDETDHSCTGHYYNKDSLSTEIPCPVSNTPLPLLINNDTSNKNESRSLSLDCYSDVCVTSQPTSERNILSNANLKGTTPDMEGHVKGKFLQPSACAEHNGALSNCPYPSNPSWFSAISNHSNEPIHTERSVTFQVPVNYYSYRCPHCSQRFGTESDYRVHIHIHEKKCPYCMEVFESTSGRSYRNLLKHVVLYHKDKDPCTMAHKSTIESALRGKK